MTVDDLGENAGEAGVGSAPQRLTEWLAFAPGVTAQMAG